MSEVAIYQPRADVAVPGAHDTDSWVQICSDVIKLANVICETEFVPDGMRGSSPAVAAAILAGREMGLGPMTSLQNIHVIKGKPTQSALLMRALVQSRGHKWEEVEVSDVRVVLRGCRKGESKWAEVTFTAQQAKTAGIDLGKYPQDKLYARASARLCRRKFADVVAGMPYTPDEIEDGEDQSDAVGVVAEAAAPADKPAPAPQGNRRRRSTPVAAKPAATPPPAAPEPPAEGLPPLPGEDEPDPTPAPGATQTTHQEPPAPAGDGDPESVNDGKLAAIWILFRKGFAFDNSDGDKERARLVCAHILNRPLTSTREMTKDEAVTVADTLALWQDIADKQGVTARAVLDAEMQAAEGQADA